MRPETDSFEASVFFIYCLIEEFKFLYGLSLSFNPFAFILLNTFCALLSWFPENDGMFLGIFKLLLNLSSLVFLFLENCGLVSYLLC